MGMRIIFLAGIVGCCGMVRGIGGDETGLGDPATWSVVGTVNRSESFGKMTLISSNATQFVGKLSDSEYERILVEESVWEIPKKVRAEGRKRVDVLLPKFQEKLNAYLPKWLKAGNCLKGKPLNIPGKRVGDLYERMREVKYENCRKVSLSLLARDGKLLGECGGVPFDTLLARTRFPEPRFEQADAKKLFETWATARWSGRLTEKERQTLFSWQFYVTEREKRPWMKLAKACDEVAADKDAVMALFDEREKKRLRRKMAEEVEPFSDFEDADVPVADFVERWYGKAIAAGFKPSSADEALVAKARASKKPWRGNANVVLVNDRQKKVKIHGSVSLKDLKDARAAWLGGLGMDEKARFDLEFDEPEGDALKSAGAVFGTDNVNSLVIQSDGAAKFDASALASFRHVNSLLLCDCVVDKIEPLSGMKGLMRFEAKKCKLGKLDFLSGCTKLRELKLEACSFSGLKSLWALESLQELSVPNSTETVDLSVVRKLTHLGTLDISGCRVGGFTSLKGHASLRWLKMEHVKGGVDSLAFLAENSELRNVEYCKEDFAPSVYREYARKSRMKEHGDDPGRMLEEAVKDRDLSEIRRLCATEVNADGALDEFEFACAGDMEIFRLLVPKASPDALSGQLQKCVCTFGYDPFPAPKNAYVPTNRLEIVATLLKCGANPDNAMKNLAHPTEEDLAWFNLMVPKTSKKVLTELLQKNVKSFGNDLRADDGARRPADRLKVVRILLKNGADPNARNFFGKTALGNAVERDGDMALVKLLIDNGADASLLYPKMELFRTFYQGHNQVWGTNRYELVELLLAHGFDANAKGQFGKTPLGEIVFFGGWHDGYDLKMVKILLSHGADPNAKQGDRMGSATDLAYGKRDAQELLALLEKHGGKVSDEAKRKKAEKAKERESDSDARRNRLDTESHVPDRVRGRRERRGSPDGRGDRVREEVDRFREQMRSCEDPEQRRKLMEEHSKRRRQIHEDESR